jgi:hypothetical protein
LVESIITMKISKPRFQQIKYDKDGSPYIKFNNSQHNNWPRSGFNVQTQLLFSSKIMLTTEQIFNKLNYMELTDREMAVRWFDRKSTTEKEQEIEKAGLLIKIENLTDSDKEWIWRKQ